MRSNHRRKRHRGKVELELTPRNKAKDRSSGSSPTKFFNPSRFFQPQTLHAFGILVLAILASHGWNQWTNDQVDYDVRYFLTKMCPVASCHTSLAPTRRTQRASRTIPAGVRLLTIPRNYTIWDVDALRSQWIRKELLRTGDSGETSAAALLAVHLARLAALLEPFPAGNSSVMQYYIESVLPTKISDFDYHPIRWDAVGELLAGTYAYDRIVATRKMIESEYDTFRDRSSSFSSQISMEAYQIARLNVMTRSFGTGMMLHRNEQELQFYLDRGVDLTRGSYAMVPILDLYDHHARPNVGFSYSESEEAFVIDSLSKIEAEVEIFDSYGKRTDSDLLAHFGFVNGDGSEYTDASVALWHSLERKESVEPKMLLRYLQYDDGYASCVAPSDSQAWAMKKTKLEILKLWAASSRRWTIRLPPRNASSRPGKRSDQPITNILPSAWNMDQLHFDGSWLFSTCRLLSLTHFDYDGQAHKLLENNKANATFLLPQTKDALEFRTLMCIARMSKTALQRLSASPFPSNATFQSPQWISAQIKLGESQALDSLKQTAFAGLQVFRNKIDSGPEFSMRDAPCSPDHVIPLLQP